MRERGNVYMCVFVCTWFFILLSQQQCQMLQCVHKCLQNNPQPLAQGSKRQGFTISNNHHRVSRRLRHTTYFITPVYRSLGIKNVLYFFNRMSHTIGTLTKHVPHKQKSASTFMLECILIAWAKWSILNPEILGNTLVIWTILYLLFQYFVG